MIAGEDVFLVLHNNTGPDFEIATAPVEPTAPENWQPLVPHDPTVRLEEVDAFAGHLVVHQRSDGLTQLRIIELGDDGVGDDYLIEFDEEIYTVGSGGNPSFTQPRVRLGYTSMAIPSSVYDYDVRSRDLTLLRRTPVLGGYDPADYEEHRLWATADDGEQVPISIVAKRGSREALSDGASGGTRPVPVLLYGYGAYEMSIDPYFSVARLSLLDRGAAFAIAHVRGGGEMGRRWYDNGKMLHKQNSFGDFVACARHLVETGWTTPELTIAEGASAGGLLMGAVANQAPEAFGGIVAGVPFVDSLTSMLDATPAADRPGVRGVGQPRGGRRGLRLPRGVRAVRQRRGDRLPADPGRDVLPRHPGPVRRAREVDRPAPGHRLRTPRLPAQDRDGGRPRRASPGATSRGTTGRSPSPGSSTGWGWPRSTPEKSLRLRFRGNFGRPPHVIPTEDSSTFAGISEGAKSLVSMWEAATVGDPRRRKGR